MKHKVCARCKTKKSLSEFTPRKDRKCGVQSWCRACYRQRRQDNIKKYKKYEKEYYQKTKHRRSLYHKELTIKLRKKIIKHYGNKCECCGESKYEFLSIDHISGSGRRNRKMCGNNGTGYYYWIIRNDYPDNLRILCHNCNLSLGFYGYCPHNKEGQ